MMIAVLNDLIFATKIRSTAQSLGVDAVCVRTAAELSRELSARRVRLVVIDLNTTGSEALSSIQVARGHESRPHVTCFVSHVDEELARQATEAGADEVMPRSRFSMQLPEILRAH